MPSNNPDVNAVRRSQQFYRLFDEVPNAGAIYQVDVSAQAIFIGPNSDVAEVNVQYADPDAPFGIREAIVSVGGPFVGQLDVDLTQTIPSTGQPQRILIAPTDVVNNAYQRPTGGGLNPARRYNVPANIDVMVALSPLPQIPTQRADRTFRFPQVPYENAAGAGNGSTDLVIPVYGRRMITCQFVTAAEYQADFYLAALQPGQDNWPHFLGSISQPATSNVVTQVAVIKASDAVEEIDGTSDIPTTYVDLPMPLPSVKGLADLLIINISTASVIAGLKYVDVFVKVSDREG